ncbi:MAG: CPBP family intramembrane metalloprotease [Bacteroidetes bacterium]|nr:CPBP family intramembrane metalloprotease [Bacteroidota bacterium]
MEGRNERPVWYTLFMVLLGGFVGVVAGSAVGILAGSLLYRGDGNFFQLVNNPDEHVLVPLLTMQGIVSVFAFFLFPYLSWKLSRRQSFKHLNHYPFYRQSIVFVVAIVLSFIVVDSVIIEWNQHVHLPEFLKWFEDWARASEDQAAKLTKTLTQFHSVGQFIIGFLVIAVVAGFCEEFLFRGLLQNELYRGTKNIHVAIWVAAFLFSAVHMQFFGFVPRLLLGVLFGYLYHWSGNIFVPMLAHAVNNGFSVVMVYLNQLGIVNVDIENEEPAPWLAVLLFALLSVACLYYYKKFLDNKKITIADGR